MHTTLLENYSPLDQFEVRDLISLDAPLLGNTHFSITNIGLYLTIGATIAFLFKALATNYNKVVSNNCSVSIETTLSGYSYPLRTLKSGFNPSFLFLLLHLISIFRCLN